MVEEMGTEIAKRCRPSLALRVLALNLRARCSHCSAWGLALVQCPGFFEPILHRVPVDCVVASALRVL